MIEDLRTLPVGRTLRSPTGCSRRHLHLLSISCGGDAAGSTVDRQDNGRKGPLAYRVDEIPRGRAHETGRGSVVRAPSPTTLRTWAAALSPAPGPTGSTGGFSVIVGRVRRTPPGSPRRHPCRTGTTRHAPARYPPPAGRRSSTAACPPSPKISSTSLVVSRPGRWSYGACANTSSVTASGKYS